MSAHINVDRCDEKATGFFFVFFFPFLCWILIRWDLKGFLFGVNNGAIFHLVMRASLVFFHTNFISEVNAS